MHEKCTPSTAFFLLHFYNRFKFFTSRVARRGQLKAGAAQPLPARRTLLENTQGLKSEGWMWTGHLEEESIVLLGVLLWRLWIVVASQQCSGCATMMKHGFPLWGLKRHCFWCRGDGCDPPASVSSSLADSATTAVQTKGILPSQHNCEERKTTPSMTLHPVCGRLPCRCFCLSFCSHSVDGEEQAHENAHHNTPTAGTFQVQLPCRSAVPRRRDHRASRCLGASSLFPLLQTNLDK